MRGFFAVVSAVFLLAAGTSPAHCSVYPVPDDDGAQYWKIEFASAEEDVIKTEHMAVVVPRFGGAAGEDVWIPGEIFTEQGLPIALNTQRYSYVARIKDPAKTLEIPLLSKLAPHHIDLDIPAREDEKIWRFNLRGMSRVTGLSYKLTDRDTVLLSRTGLPGGEPFPARLAGPPLRKPFNLVWDIVRAGKPCDAGGDNGRNPDVLSPTWFALNDETGVTLNDACLAYVEQAHAGGIRVWGLVSNGFHRNRTHKFLGNKKAQDLFIARMLAYARIYGLDGINIDFENVNAKDSAKLTSFVRRFTECARTMGLVMSIDVNIPSKWSKSFDHRALGQIVDYVAVMTYDEHWRASPKAGSTASLPWVTRGLAGTLALVPPNKLLLGVPFYTREWIENKANGTITSKTLAMVSTDELLRISGAQRVWLADIGQHFFQFKSADATHKVWIEDARSITLRMELVKKKSLAGAAFWRRGFEKPEIWHCIP